MVRRTFVAIAIALTLASCQTAPGETRGVHWQCAEGGTFITQAPELRAITLILGDRRIDMQEESALTMTRELRVERYRGDGLMLVRNVRTEPPFTVIASIVGAPQPYTGCREVR